MTEDSVRKFDARFFEGGDWSAGLPPASTPQAERAHLKSSIQRKLMVDDGRKLKAQKTRAVCSTRVSKPRTLNSKQNAKLS